MYTLAIRIAYKYSLKKTNHQNVNVHHNSNKGRYHVITGAVVFGTFLLCWLPYCCIAVVTTFRDNPTTLYIRGYTHISGLLNSALNWMIYGFRNNNFRKAFKLIINCSTTRDTRRTFINAISVNSTRI